MEIPEGYKDMMIMVFSVHAQKPQEVRDKYELFLDSLLYEEEKRNEYTNVRLEAFKTADANGDGVLDREEYNTYIQKMNEWQDAQFGGHNAFTPEQIKQIFDQVSNGTDSISMEAFVHNMQLEGYVFSVMVEDGTFKALEAA